MRKFWPVVVGVSLAVNLALVAFLVGSRGGMRGTTVDNAPVLLQRIQAIGRLHTVKFNFERTGALETFRNADPSLSWIPGADSVVSAATRNSVTMTLRGTVETGIDFTKVRMTLADGKATVTLPKAEVYEPTVDAELHDVRSGAFWKDEEIQLKAIASAKREFRKAAIASGGKEKATEQAREVIGQLLRGAGVGSVEFL